MDPENFRNLLNIVKHLDRIATLIPQLRVDATSAEEVLPQAQLDDSPIQYLRTINLEQKTDPDSTGNSVAGLGADFDESLALHVTPSMLGLLLDRMSHMLEFDLPEQLEKKGIEVRAQVKLF